MDEEQLDCIYEDIISPNLTSFEVKSLVWYSKNGFSRINKYVLKKYMYDKKYTTEFIEQTIDNIRKCIRLSQSFSPMKLYHGTTIELFDNMPISEYIKKDGTIHTGTFLSTSIQKNIAAGFSGRFMGSNLIILEINIPIGYPALWMGKVSANRDEKEVLLLDHIDLDIDSYEDMKLHGIPYTKIKVIAR